MPALNQHPQSLTIHQKQAIFEAAEVERPTTVMSQFKLKRSTFYDIMKSKNRIINALKKGVDNRRFRLKPAKYGGLEDMVFEWVKREHDRGLQITGPMIKLKAKQIGIQLKQSDFKASNGWLDKFKKRYHIELRHGHALRFLRKPTNDNEASSSGMLPKPRGRPRKVKPEVDNRMETNVKLITKPRGRPRKVKPELDNEIEINVEAAPESSHTIQLVPESSQNVPKRRGRPSKIKPNVEPISKPILEPTQNVPKRRGRPSKINTETILTPTLEPTQNAQKRRGRPLKVVQTVPEPNIYSTPEVVLNVQPTPESIQELIQNVPKRRGRPFKIARSFLKPIQSALKRRGRPRKVVQSIPEPIPELISESRQNVQPNPEPIVKRGRGRPRIKPLESEQNVEIKNEQSTSEETQLSQSAPKKRGRPRIKPRLISPTPAISAHESLLPTMNVQPIVETIPEPVERPESPIPSTSNQPIIQKKRRGRPPKSIKPVEQQTEASLEPVERSESPIPSTSNQPIVQKKRRGRPPKSIKPVEQHPEIEIEVIAKRRGRPPKTIQIIPNVQSIPEPTSIIQTIPEPTSIIQTVVQKIAKVHGFHKYRGIAPRLQHLEVKRGRGRPRIKPLESEQNVEIKNEQSTSEEIQSTPTKRGRPCIKPRSFSPTLAISAHKSLISTMNGNNHHEASPESILNVQSILEPIPVVQKRRGRPFKVVRPIPEPIFEASSNVQPIFETIPATTQSVPKRRGRPFKVARLNFQSSSESPIPSTSNQSIVQKKRRGRPPKTTVLVEQHPEIETVAVVKRRGRPPKTKKRVGAINRIGRKMKLEPSERSFIRLVAQKMEAEARNAKIETIKIQDKVQNVEPKPRPVEVQEKVPDLIEVHVKVQEPIAIRRPIPMGAKTKTPETTIQRLEAPIQRLETPIKLPETPIESPDSTIKTPDFTAESPDSTFQYPTESQMLGIEPGTSYRTPVKMNVEPIVIRKAIPMKAEIKSPEKTCSQSVKARSSIDLESLEELHSLVKQRVQDEETSVRNEETSVRNEETEVRNVGPKNSVEPIVQDPKPQISMKPQSSVELKSQTPAASSLSQKSTIQAPETSSQYLKSIILPPRISSHNKISTVLNRLSNAHNSEPKVQDKAASSLNNKSNGSDKTPKIKAPESSFHINKFNALDKAPSSLSKASSSHDNKSNGSDKKSQTPGSTAQSSGSKSQVQTPSTTAQASNATANKTAETPEVDWRQAALMELLQRFLPNHRLEDF